MNGEKSHPPPALVEQGGTKSEVEVRMNGWLRSDGATAVVRAASMAASVTALALMVTAHETGMGSFYGFQFQLYSSWSLSTSLEYLVGVSAATAAYALLQLLVTVTKLRRKSPIISSRRQAWLCFVADQIFGYAMMSGASAALGVTSLNQTGIKHMPLPNFCKPLQRFCDHAVVSVALVLLSCFLLAVSALQDVMWLSR